MRNKIREEQIEINQKHRTKKKPKKRHTDIHPDDLIKHPLIFYHFKEILCHLSKDGFKMTFKSDSKQYFEIQFYVTLYEIGNFTPIHASFLEQNKQMNFRVTWKERLKPDTIYFVKIAGQKHFPFSGVFKTNLRENKLTLDLIEMLENGDSGEAEGIFMGIIRDVKTSPEYIDFSYEDIEDCDTVDCEESVLNEYGPLNESLTWIETNPEPNFVEALFGYLEDDSPDFPVFLKTYGLKVGCYDNTGQFNESDGLVKERCGESEEFEHYDYVGIEVYLEFSHEIKYPREYTYRLRYPQKGDADLDLRFTFTTDVKYIGGPVKAFEIIN